MTRRARSKPQFLTPDQYIARATAGLTGAEKVDAAAELRAHLLERVAEHEAQGFSRVEAEYLAVQSMGEPPLAQAKPWGAWLTRAGWGVLALMLLGGGGWYTYREWMPPKEGVKLEAASPADINYLFSVPDAPRGNYQAATLTYPKGTQTVIYANVSGSEIKNGNDTVFLSVSNVADLTAQNIRGRIPNSFRHQERWLWTTERMTCDGQPRARLYVTAQTLPSPFWDKGSGNKSGLGSITGACNNPSLRLREVQERLDSTPPSTIKRVIPPDGEGVVMLSAAPIPLRLNEWTVLSRLVVDSKQDSNTFQVPPLGPYSKQAHGVYIAVLPLSRRAANDGYSYGAGLVKLKGDLKPLPPLPPTMPPRAP